MNVSQTLQNQRQIASDASGGISNEPVYKTFLQIIEQLDLRGDCLDFGAGIGNFSRQLQSINRFSSITAIDIMQPPAEVDKSIKWISWDLNNSTDIATESFDVIVSAEVIEHLENPRAVTREWFRLLRPGGTLVLSTPNNESWRSLIALIAQVHFVQFGDTCYPAHITALLRKDIEHVLIEAGFSRPKFVCTNIGNVPKLLHWQWQTISGGLLKGLRFSDNILAFAHKQN